jgi:2-oxoglutarate ferredoxin oxidoreductase subunit alpha
LPTKTEQADLLQALYGRNSDSPVAIVAPATPSECFTMMIEACRIALKYMVPTFFLSDGYLANGSEPWLVPSASDLPKVEARFTTEVEGFHPFRRDPDTLARNWAVPGTPGLEHRIGGIEKSYDSGNISYDPDNHEKMIHVRQEKVDRIARDLAPTEIFGSQSGGDLLILGWGSTYGAIRAATTAAREQGKDVSHVHIRHLNPLPNDLGDILKKFRRVLIPEMNMGQLSMVIRAKYLVDAKSYSKVQGKPFKVSEILARIERELAH